MDTKTWPRLRLPIYLAGLVFCAGMEAGQGLSGLAPDDFVYACRFRATRKGIEWLKPLN
jgi:hypothetical protein